MQSTNYFWLFAAFCFGLFWSPVGLAQNCGSAFVQQGGGDAGYIICTPVEDYQPVDQAAAAQQALGPEWATRWGAIAYDGKAGHFGGKEGLESKRRAEKAAIKECKKNGGSACKVITSYYNQCGAMAWGNNFMAASRGPDRDVTIQQAVASCNNNSGNCQAYYAGCSLPAKIR
jgi:Domain of unknown function (DUF4189)